MRITPLRSYYWRQKLKAVPGVLTLQHLLSAPNVRRQLATSKNMLCLEGFPRSGNGFSNVCLSLVLGVPPTSIAGHTHSVSNVRRALNRRLPTFVLLREPEAACTSLLAWGGCATLDDAFQAYEQFHTSLLPILGCITIVPFETLTKDPQAFLDLVSDRLGLPSATWDEMAAAGVAAALERSDRVRQIPGFLRTSLPTAEKERRSEALAEPLSRSATKSVLVRCKSLHGEILGSAPDLLGRAPAPIRRRRGNHEDGAS